MEIEHAAEIVAQASMLRTYVMDLQEPALDKAVEISWPTLLQSSLENIQERLKKKAKKNQT